MISEPGGEEVVEESSVSADSVKKRPSAGPSAGFSAGPSAGPGVAADLGQDGKAQRGNLYPLRSSGADAKPCQCSGNCGRPFCAVRRTRNRRGEDDRCSGVCYCPESQYCKECGCGVFNCKFLRNGKDGRWRFCKRHCRQLREGGVFVSRGVVQQVESTWSRELRLVARNVWWMQNLALEDFVAFDEAYKQELDSSAGVLGQSACLRLWVAAWLQDSNHIRHWARVTQDSRGEPSVSARSRPWQGREWADAIALVGRDVIESGGVLDSGREQLGLVEFLRLCGVDSANSKKRTRDGVIPSVADRITQRWELVLRTVFADGLAVPKTAREFREVITILDQRLCEFPAQFKQGARPFKIGERSHFIRQCVASKFCYAMATRLPAPEFAVMRWADFAAMRADMNESTSVLDAHTCGDIAEKFGMHALHVPAWCCLVSSSPQGKIAQHLANPKSAIEDAAVKLQASLGRALGCPRCLRNSDEQRGGVLSHEVVLGNLI